MDTAPVDAGALEICQIMKQMRSVALKRNIAYKRSLRAIQLGADRRGQTSGRQYEQQPRKQRRRSRSPRFLEEAVSMKEVAVPPQKQTTKAPETLPPKSAAQEFAPQMLPGPLPEIQRAAATFDCQRDLLAPVEVVPMRLSRGLDEKSVDWPKMQSDSSWRPSSKAEPKVLWEDDDIMVLSKPCRWHCDDDEAWARPLDPRQTSAEALVKSQRREHVMHFIQLKFAGRSDFPLARSEDGCDRVWCLGHRLDVDTSGCLLIGKTQLGFNHLKKAFHTHSIGKEYICLVRGSVEKPKGVIDEPITVTRNHRYAYTSRRGQRAFTTYRVVERYSCGGEPYTLCAVSIHTGRTHQIRVHMKSIGHPLVGDAKYGQPDTMTLRCPRIFLHARCIYFPTVRGIAQTVTDQLPEDLRATLHSRWMHRAE